MTGATAAPEHARLAEFWFAKGWAEGDVSVAGEVFADDFVLNGRKVGPDGPRRSVRAVHSAFSDIGVTLDLVLTDGSHVVTHYTTTARHTGVYRGVPASGRWIKVSGIVIWEIRDGKVVRDWNVFDTGEVVAQITAPAADGK
ncbi:MULTISPECIES: ester cyclase [Streptomyces]|uniref:ester cyclase n=1 Tax=Streptomyces TaxID=1883 RepID=UPI001CD12963|nr:ester cyclase [Streptomyces sp. PSKA30]MBZ9641624.1 ester cyclase [Streptomyces sp. PSKA30]